LLPLLLAGAISLSTVLFAQQQEQEPANLQQQRAQWLRARRSDATGKIPPLGRALAYQQMQRMRAQELQQLQGASFASLSPAQQASLTSWSFIGPQPLADPHDPSSLFSGRVTALAVDPTNEEVVYAGAAEGGLWKTTDGGQTWTELTDHQGSLSSGSIAIDPNNPSTIYYGTGEEDFFGFEYPGNGILKSTDSGTTWSVVSSLFAGSFVGGIAVSPSNSNLLMAVAEGGSGNGIWRSTNAGLNWSRVTSCPSAGTGLAFDPTGDTIYAGCESGQLFKSTDAGVTWTQINSNAMPSGFSGAVSIAVSKSSPSTVYVSYGGFSGSALYKTTNAGSSWTQLATQCFTQCPYNNVVTVDPTNPNVVFVGEVNFHRSLDGGSTWDFPSGNGPTLHADNHAFAFSPAGDKLYVGDDGGVFSSTNFTVTTSGSVTWTDLNSTLAITQFYPGMVSDPNNINDAVGGTQDNGSNHYIGALQWAKVFCCDGGYAGMDFTNPSTFYVTCQDECIWKTTDDGNSFTQVETGITGTDGFNFINPLVLDPSNHQRLYYAAGQLYQSTNGASSWIQVTSPSFLVGTNAVAPAPNNENVVYLASGNVIWVTSNALSGASATWTRRNTGLSAFANITAIAVDPTNYNTAYVTAGGFTGGGKHVFRTTNEGVNWVDISGSLPDIPAENIVIDYAFPGTLYLATDAGIYATSNFGGTWTPVVNGLPNVVVMSLELHQLTRILRAGTYGRSAWDLQLPKPTPPCTASTTNPSVTICTPGANAVVPSPVKIVGETTDSHAIQIMQVYVDGIKKYQSATPTLSTSITLANGQHALTVQAVDTVGQLIKAKESIFACTPGTANPSVTICLPKNGAKVSSPVHIIAKTTDSHTVATMQVLVDGVKKYQASGSSLNISLSIAAGTHTLTVKAIDSINQNFKQTITISVP
jgi:photosystem II stability/assembly factor-like uncharacterized protein